MKTRKIFGYGLTAVLFTLAFAVLPLAGCNDGNGTNDDGNESGAVPTALRGKWVNGSSSVEFTANQFRSSGTGASWYDCRVTDAKIEYYVPSEGWVTWCESYAVSNDGKSISFTGGEAGSVVFTKDAESNNGNNNNSGNNNNNGNGGNNNNGNNNNGGTTGQLVFYLNENASGYKVKGTAISGAVDIPASYNGLPVTHFFFSGTGLTSVNIPNSVMSIGWALDNGCTGLTNITVAADNPNYASEGGILYNKAKTDIYIVPRGISGNVTIPNSVTNIYSYAFWGCTGLTSITIPAI